MSGGAPEAGPTPVERARPWAALAGLLLFLVALVPPLSTWTRHSEVLESLQFSVLAVVVPCLVVVGAPWRLVGLAAPGPGPAAASPPRALDRLAEGRRRHPEFARALGFLAFDLVAVVAWQTPAAVDGLVAHGWLAPVEAVTLVAAGVALWVECVSSPPLAPRLVRPLRALLAALAMWAMWAMAYLVGLAHASWYHGFIHRPGHGLSAAADQQFSTAVLWAVAAAAFLPVIFVNVVTWLRSDEDPDDELYRLIRAERRRGWAAPPPGGLPGGPEAGRTPGPG